MTYMFLFGFVDAFRPHWEIVLLHCLKEDVN